MASKGYYIRVSSGAKSTPQYWNQLEVSSNQKNIYYNYGNAGIGIPVPKASLHLVNNCCIGSAFASSNVPTDSLIVSSNVGIGTALPQAALHVEGNAFVTGNISAGNLGQFRNRIINGDMRVDQRGANGTQGVGAGSSSTNATTSYTVDRFAIATGASSGTLCAAQTTLSSADQAAVGGTFTNAMAIGVAPASSLDVYYPFDGSVNDASGNGYNLTATGTMSYVPGRVGSTAVYLANEANITAQTAAANYIRNTTYVFASSFTVSYWVLYTKLNGGEATISFITNTVSGSSPTGALFICGITTGVKIGFWGVVDSGAVSSVALNTWYHYAAIYKPGIAQLFVNGTSVASVSSTFVQSGFMMGNATTTYVTQAFAGYIDDFRIYNRALSTTEIAALAAIAPVQPAPATTLASGLSTRLTFDNVTTDSQGTLPAPVATGTTVYSSSSKSGTASLDLTGNTAGGTMTVGQTYTLSSGSFALPLSVGGWINPNSPTTAGYQVVFSIGNNTSTGSYSAQIYFENSGSGKFYFNAIIGGTSYSCPLSPFTLTASTWYHLAFTITNSYLESYINGVLISTTPTGAGALTIVSGTGSPTQLRIGAITGTSLLYAFKGLIDDVRIYTRELSPIDVAGLYYSYQPSPYVLFQQPIEGLNVADLAWGTTAAQPATVSAWIKNNTASAQQFSLSAGNAGAAAAITAITFETDSGFNDTLGMLTNPIGTNVVYSTSIYKVGTRSLDFTANTTGGTPTSSISYNYNYSTLPLSVSLWINPTAFPSSGSYSEIISIGPYTAASGSWSLNLVFHGINSQMCGEAYVSGVQYQCFVPLPALSQWQHVSLTLNTGGSMIMYVNGVAVVSTALPSTALSLTCGATTVAPNILKLGCFYNNTLAYTGYIDDVRIYNKALSANEVYQLYAKNATATTISQYLLPRSYLYTTPSIASGAWQKISFTIPGDTTDGIWAKDTTCGLNLALCLGSGGPYISTGTSGWTSTKYLSGSNIQAFGGSASNFLATAGNAIYLTGVQLEKGTLVTPFEFRPYGTELQLCQRYYWQPIQMWILQMNRTGGYKSIEIKTPITMRTTPTVTYYFVTGWAIGSLFANMSTTDVIQILFQGCADDGHSQFNSLVCNAEL